jgi:hypothetical protein
MSLYTIVYRSTKGSPLTNSEVDGNFQAFDTYKVNVDGSMPFTGPVTAPSFVGVHNGIVQNSGASQLGTGTFIGYGATANQEVDFGFQTNSVQRWYMSVSGTAGEFFKLNYTDTSGNYKQTTFSVDNATGVLSFPSVVPQITAAMPSLSDSSSNIPTTAWVQGQGYITANGTAKYVTTITSAQVTGALAYTPVQQGTGTGQGSNVIKIGWGTNTGNGVKITVDSTDQGFIPMSSTAPGKFTYSGDIVATGNVTAYSDESLKKNWDAVPSDFVENLTTVKSGSFERVDLNGERQVGVSAQSLQEVMPLAVQQNDDGLMSVSYGNAALVAAIELAKRVVELEARLAALEGK